MRLFIVSFFLLAIAFVSFSEDRFNGYTTPQTNTVVQDASGIPEHLKASFLRAMEFYPELADQNIQFKQAKIKTTLNVRPTLASVLFKKKENREYIIRINNRTDNQEILIDDIPYEARVGLFGHELAHIVDYKGLNAFQIMGRGIGYAFPGYHESYEKYIDLITVEAGLGNHLYEWASYIQDHPHVPQSYKLFKKQFYMQQDDILDAIQEVKLGNLSSEF